MPGTNGPPEGGGGNKLGGAPEVGNVLAIGTGTGTGGATALRRLGGKINGAVLIFTALPHPRIIL